MIKPPSYLSAFLGHQLNLLYLSASACAAVFATIPYGWSALGSIAVITLGVEILGSLFIPDLPSFRAAVDSQVGNASRAARQQRLVAELASRGEEKPLSIFRHLQTRISALYQTAGEQGTTLAPGDVDKLADLTLDYLSLCAVNLSLKERRASVSEQDVRKRVSVLQAQLDDLSLAPEETRQLKSALTEYADAADRSRRLDIRQNALEATLLALPDKIEEVYQLVMASPFSTGMSDKIEESLSRLRIAEEVAAEFNAIDTDNFDRPVAKATPTVTPITAARRAARSVKN